MAAVHDRRPIYWALCVLLCLLLAWAATSFVGGQRMHNTPFWQHWRPVMLKSAPQSATPVEPPPALRVDQTIVQTERGVYFLTGSRYRPAPGEARIVVANEAWELYLCAVSGDRCMSIHSFCADTGWADIKRDANGLAPNCYAPRRVLGSNRAVQAITAPPPNRAGAQGGRQRTKPSAGMSHPREWAEKMGLPVGATP